MLAAITSNVLFPFNVLFHQCPITSSARRNFCIKLASLGEQAMQVPAARQRKFAIDPECLSMVVAGDKVIAMYRGVRRGANVPPTRFDTLGTGHEREWAAIVWEFGARCQRPWRGQQQQWARRRQERSGGGWHRGVRRCVQSQISR